LTDPKYKNAGTPRFIGFNLECQTRVIEECSELIKALCKADQFGWYGFHPDDPDKIPNIESVLKEMADVIESLGDLADLLKEIEPVNKHKWNQAQIIINAGL